MNNSKKRNIVLIICDEMRADFLNAYGADFIPTPNIDALAENGVVFDNAITAATVCGPARAAIITGQNVCGHDNWTNDMPFREGTEFFAERLYEDGYMTAAVGCFDHEPRCQYKVHFNEYLAFLQERHPEEQSPYARDGYHFKYPEEEFYDYWTADRAIEFIEGYTKTGKAPNGATAKEENAPFYLFCGFLSPHSPAIPPREVSGTVDPAKLPKVRNSTRQDIAPVEKYRRAILNPTEAVLDPESVAEERQRARLAYAEMIVEADRLVGRIVKTLKEQGIYDNTTIIFSADHGSVDNDYNVMTKGPWPYKSQLFIPLIVSNHPRVKPGTRCDALCGNLDIGATILDVADDHKKFKLSRSLIETAEGKLPEREVNMSEFCDSCKTLVDKRYTFTYYPFTGETCLYDRVADPEERINLGGKEEYREIERKFLMHAVDFMILNKGIRIEAHDLVPEVKAGIEKKDPTFLDDFDIAFPIANMQQIERLKALGLDWEMNEFCKTRPIKAHYGVYFNQNN